MASPRTAETRPRLPETLDVTIDHLSPEGDGVALTDHGPVRVRFVLPGERVRVRPFWAKGSRRVPAHIRADLLDVIEPSPERVAPECPYFGQCGGCQYQHVAYPSQLAIKRRHLADALAAYPSLAGVEPGPVIGCPEPFGYRNQVRFSFDRDGRLSFTLAGRRRPVPIDRCSIAGDPINDLLAQLQGRYRGRHQVALRVGFATGDRLTFPPNGEPAGDSPAEYLTEQILGFTFQIHHSSFFQVNTRPLARVLPECLAGLGWPAEGDYSQADILGLLVIAGLGLTGSERVIDAYAGVGVFARLVAARCREVIAIEESATAAADAQHNLTGLPNAIVCRAKTEVVLPRLAGALDAVILDPARPGCAPAVIDALIRRPAGRVVYVSCEPATLARDLDGLRQAYQVDWIRPLDMFPQTRHLETIVRLSRRAALA